MKRKSYWIVKHHTHTHTCTVGSHLYFFKLSTSVSLCLFLLLFPSIPLPLSDTYTHTQTKERRSGRWHTKLSTVGRRMRLQVILRVCKWDFSLVSRIIFHHHTTQVSHCYKFCCNVLRISPENFYILYNQMKKIWLVKQWDPLIKRAHCLEYTDYSIQQGD